MLELFDFILTADQSADLTSFLSYQGYCVTLKVLLARTRNTNLQSFKLNYCFAVMDYGFNLRGLTHLLDSYLDPEKVYISSINIICYFII